MAGDGGGAKQINDDAAIEDDLGVLSVSKGTVFYIIIVFDSKEIIIDASV